MTEVLTEPDRTIDVSEDMLPGYEIISIIGTGGFGTVFRARQLKLDRIVAVKVIQLDRIANEELAARCQTEALALAKFHHPNIVQVFDYGRDQRRMFIAMELLEGEDLAQRIRRGGPLDERAVWAIGRQTAASLAHALSCGVIHRDVKPANLYLIPQPTGLGLPDDLPMLKVTDFGLALTKWAGSPADEHPTSVGALLGTPTYMAPEQFQRTKELDHRADIYALGATLYHSLTGQPPFSGATVWDVMTRKLQGPPDNWPRGSPGTVALIQSMMATDPDLRPRSYEGLIERIDHLSVARNIPSIPIAAPMPTRRPIFNWIWASVATLGLIGSVAGFIIQQPRLRHEYQRVESETYLFDPAERGKDWDVTTSATGWRDTTVDANGEKSLAWEGLILRRLPPAENYRVNLSCDVPDAGLVEIHFAMPATDIANSRRLVLRISKAGGAILGEKHGIKGTFVPHTKSVTWEAARLAQSDSAYRDVSIARQGTDWVARFGKNEVGCIADDGTPKAPIVCLYAEGPEGVHPKAQEINFETLQWKPAN